MVWISVLSLFVVATAVGMKDLFPDTESRRTFALLAESNPSQMGLLGHVYSDSIGGLVAWRVSAFALFVGLFAVFTMTRHSQALEEGGQLELLLSQPMHRLLPWRMAIVWSMLNVGVLAIVFVFILIGQGFAWASALLFGVSFVLDGWVMTAVTALVSNISQRARTVNAVAAGIMVTGFFINVRANLGVDWLRWGSPIVWIQRTQPFAGEYWWPVAIALLLVAVLWWGADVIARRREYGVSLLAPHAGVAQASPMLLRAWGLWWVQQRTSIVAWWGAVGLLGVFLAGLGQSMEQQFRTSEQLVGIMQMLGHAQDMTLAYLAFMHLIVAFAAAAAGLQVIATMRGHELRGLLEPLCAGIRSRTHIYVVAWLGSMLTALGVMLGYAIAIGLAHQLTIPTSTITVYDSVASMLVYVPAMTCMVSLGWLVYAGAPRVFALIWIWFVANIAVTWFNDMWGLSPAVTQWFPFYDMPSLFAQMPWQPEDALPATLVALCASLGAWWLWRRRDLIYA
jgi:ABC-2 type transport system permease protein